MKTGAGILAGVLLSGALQAHEGSSEERAMRMLGLLNHLDKSWAALQRETDAGRRATLLASHAKALGDVQEALGDAADKSPCVMMESGDAGRQLACLVDTEARLRATERLLGHVVNRLTLSGQ